MRKDGVLENLVAILSRYDVVLFQEIRDSSGTAIAGLMDALNAAGQSVCDRAFRAPWAYL